MTFQASLRRWPVVERLRELAATKGALKLGGHVEQPEELFEDALQAAQIVYLTPFMALHDPPCLHDCDLL